MISRNGGQNQTLPHPIILAILLLFLTLCLILRSLLPHHEPSSSLEEIQDVTLLSSLGELWKDWLKSMHVHRSKSKQHHPWPYKSSSLRQRQEIRLPSSFSNLWKVGIRSMHAHSQKSSHQYHPWPHPTFTHTSPVADQDIIIDEDDDKVTVKMRLPNRPKSVRSIEDVEISVLDGGNMLMLKIHARPPPPGRRKVGRSTTKKKKNTRATRPHWTFDQEVDFDDGIKVDHNGMKAFLKDGELTIVARKLNQGTKDMAERQSICS